LKTEVSVLGKAQYCMDYNITKGNVLNIELNFTTDHIMFCLRWTNTCHR